MKDFLFYALCIVAAVVAFYTLKKLAGCVIKAVLLIAIVLVLILVYYYIMK